MVPPPPNVRRHFLPWDRPLLPQAVAFLAGDWRGGAPLDLAAVLVVVPTRQSGRRLREAIAGHAAARGQAAFPPRVLAPDGLVVPAAGTDTASPLESLLAWTEIFRGLDLAGFREVFPVDPPAQNFAWALRLAQEFAHLQRSLAETGLRLADVPAGAGADFPETERWRQIAALEQLHAARLAALGRRDGQAAKIWRAAAPVLPDGIERVVLLGTPDPLPLALQALAVHARNVPVDVVVFAPAAEASAFDGWGRPLDAAWTGRVLELADFERRVQVCADPAAQAERMVAVARSYGEPEGVLGVGVADPEVRPLLEAGLRHAGLAGFNPEGRARHGDGLFQLLAALAGLAREDSFAAIGALARCPDFLEFLRSRHGAGFSAARALAGLDELHAEHLPPDLAEASRHAPDSEVLAAAAELRAVLNTGTFPANAAAALEMIFSGRRFDLVRPGDALAAEAAGAWTDVMRETKAAAARFEGVTNAEWWDVALHLYGGDSRTEEKPAGAVELSGWLELLWEDAPHLLIAGLNDGRVPDAVVGDPFLPESLRERVGLKTNAARFARDAYLLAALFVTMTWYFPQLGFLMPRRVEQFIYPISKTDLDILRFAHFLALAAITVRLVPNGWPGLKSPWLWPLILCGQHSLEIFCLGVFLAFAGEFILAEFAGGPGLQALVTVGGILIMWGVAWVISWYKHSADKGASKTKSTGGNADLAGGGA